MKRITTILTMLMLVCMGAGAESKLSKAVAGSYLFDSSNPALTINKGGTATITSNDGAIVIHHDNLSTVTNSRTYAAVVMRVDMPTTAPGSFSNFINLKTSSNNTASIGLGVTTEGKLKGTWEAGKNAGTGEYGPTTSSAITGEHTIVLLCNNDGTTIYVDDASTSVNNIGLKCGTQWTDLRIESDYVSSVKSVYVFSGEQKSNISNFFSELNNVVTVANEETKSVSDNSTATRFFVASGGTLTIDAAYDMDKIEGAGDVILDVDATISGNISTVATGKLTINEGKTLTLGAGDSQTNSIESFSSIDLAGTIKHNNSKATFNGVTVPTSKTGKIFAFDMGTETDGFKLAGTTTLNGNLNVCSKYNFQMKVDVLAGSGDCLICGTTGDVFDATKTQSNEASTINIASASSYTGNVTVNNSQATVNLAGNLVGSSWTKTKGTLTYTGSNLNGTTLDGVILSSGSTRITTSNTVNIKNLAGNNLNNTSKLYAFVGSGTINFFGTCDLTKKSDGTDCNSANIGYASSAAVVIKAGANVTAGVVLNNTSNNAPITVEATATLTTVGSTDDSNSKLLVYSSNLTNNGTINLNASGRISDVSTLSGSGTLNVAAGDTIKAPSVPSTMTLTGAGDVVLTSFPTSTAPTLSTWTGAIKFPDGGSSSTNLQDIFNAWGNTNSTIKLNNVSGGYISKGGTVNPTLNILSGKTLTLNNGYSNSNATLTKVTGAGTLDRQNWSSGSNHNLYITTLTDFTGTLKGTGHPIIVKKLVLEDYPDADALLIKTSGTVSLNTEEPDGLYVGLQRSSAYSWETKTVEDVEGIYVSSLDQVQQKREQAVATVSPYFSYIGTGVGKYTISLGVDKNYTTVSDFETAILAWSEVEDCSIPTVTLNQPATGKFYRFHIGDKYMCNVADNDNVRTVTETNNDASTIFYLAQGATYNYLVGYADGYGFNYGYCKAVSPGIFNSFTFPESATIGKYLIYSDQGTEDNAYSHRYINVSDSKLAKGQGAWTITEVSTLPVTISTAQYATLYSPVALTIPSGVKAYTGKVNGSNLTLSEVETTIPANTAVILKADPEINEETTFNFATTTSADFSGDNDLAGYPYTITKTDGDLVLGYGTYGIGFYGLNGTTLAGFKSYLPSDKVASARELKMVFDDEVTGIRTIDNGQKTLKNGAFYDLSGRRVQNPQHGLYIVNGKKVVIK